MIAIIKTIMLTIIITLIAFLAIIIIIIKTRIHCETFLSEHFIKYSFRGMS